MSPATAERSLSVAWAENRIKGRHDGFAFQVAAPRGQLAPEQLSAFADELTVQATQGRLPDGAATATVRLPLTLVLRG